MARTIDWLYRARAAALRGLWGISPASAWASQPDDRYQARLALYLWAAEHLPGRRVLDLSGETGYGAAALKACHAEAVTSVTPRRGERAWARRTYPGGGLEFVGAIPTETASPWDVILDLEAAPGRQCAPRASEVPALLPRLSSQGSVMLARTMPSGEEDEDWKTLLEEEFLYRRRYALLPPEDYEPDWDRASPARARAREYRVEPWPWAETRDRPPISEILVARWPRRALGAGPHRLHVGSGQEHLEGWVNIDLEELPGVDLVLDVTRDFDFRDAEAIYAEHFLEHLPVSDFVRFLVACHGALRDDGVLRLSTPSLDYVWETLYQSQAPADEKIERALSINRAFYGWGHRFLWNRELLAEILRRCGFDRLEWPAYGESRWPFLRGIERHETYPDREDLPHVLIVEARKGELDELGIEAALSHLYKEFEVMLEGWDWSRS